MGAGAAVEEAGTVEKEEVPVAAVEEGQRRRRRRRRRRQERDMAEQGRAKTENAREVPKLAAATEGGWDHQRKG